MGATRGRATYLSGVRGEDDSRLSAAMIYALLLAVLLAGTAAQAAFNPPVVVRSVRAEKGRLYFIDRGTDAHIKVGDVLNVFRRVTPRNDREASFRIQLGTMTITESEPGISLGTFDADPAIAGNPLLRMKTPVRNDLVIPKLKIDSSVLFEAGAATLQEQVAREELEKVVRFVRSFSPSRLVIEGHTDSDGDEASNKELSMRRAETVRDYLVSNFDEISDDMVTAVGHGESRPIVPNDTPENRALNRRIEVLVWE